MWGHPVLIGAVAGVVTATAIDRQAFAAFKSFDEAAAYNWRLAAWRACQGAVIGAMSALGLGFA